MTISISSIGDSEAPVTSPFLPTRATIRSIVPMAMDNYLFEFTEKDTTLLTCQPGQFVQLWIPGVGECPISVCSGHVGETIELLVRKTGRVTKALYEMAEGDQVGIRGPYGKGFPLEQYRGRDVCVVAGGLGIAPMRSLWQYLLHHREDFGNVVLVYGMRHSDELLFRQEFKVLMRQRDIEVYIAAEEIVGPELPPIAMQLGRVTDMLKMSPINGNFQAAICGPPIMYRYVIAELHAKGVSDQNIWVSLERHMKCGIGKCGHCFIGGRFDCKAGPVFQLSDLKHVPEVIEYPSPEYCEETVSR